MFQKKISLLILFLFAFQTVQAGILIKKSNGVTLTGADGIKYIGTTGVTLTGADGFLNYAANGVTLTGADGVTLTGADGVTLTGADGVTLTGADGVTYTGGNGVTLTGADGVTLTGADGATLTGADGVTLTGADGTTYHANLIKIIKPDGVTLTGADGVTLTGADGVTLTGADGATLTGADGATLTGVDGVTLTGADGVTLTGADGVTLTGADAIYGLGDFGIVFSLIQPAGVTLTGADGVTLTGADGVTLTGADGVTLTGADGATLTGADGQGTGQTVEGLESVDPELAKFFNEATDDSTVNAVIVYHNLPSQQDLNDLQGLGILGGTRFRVLPMISVTATRQQFLAVSTLANVRSIYGNRTLTLNADSFFKNTAVHKVAPDTDLRTKNGGMPISGKNVTVAVLDTGVNSQHNDLAGRVIQNVKLADTQSASVGFTNPVPVENVVNTDPVSGHGTFVAGLIAASGISSGGKYNGVAPGAKILGLSAGDLNLTHVLAGFDYLLERGAAYNARVVNCSFSANTVYDSHDPVNVATRLLTENGINVVFSAGNSGPGNGTLNPYAAAPWVISVGATDENGKLADFSSRGGFGSTNQKPSLVATGVNVVSLRGITGSTGVLGVATGNDVQRLTPGELPFYTTATGTSFSAPQVAGAIALMLEANPNLTPAKIKDILQRTSTPLPAHFQHEVGAGVLNTYAAVLESAFPDRQMGLDRAILQSDAVEFKTSITNVFDETVNFGANSPKTFTVPVDSVQTGVHIAWGNGASDLGLKLFDAENNLVGNSNYLNVPGLTGKREKILLNNPSAQNYTAVVRHTGGAGISQRYFGAVETTTVKYSVPDLADLSNDWQRVIKQALRTFLVTPQGKKFKPGSSATRLELAESLVRSGRVLKYMAGSPVYRDVKDQTTRNAIESVQRNSDGQLFVDVADGDKFKPFDSVSKLITAIALVKAAGLEDQTATATLPAGITDANSIPVQYRGYVAVALQKGFVILDNGKFRPDHSLTRAELALGIVSLCDFGF